MPITSALICWGDREPATRTITDLGPRGFFVFVDDTPSMGTEVQFELLEEDGSVSSKGLARVVYVRAGAGGGVGLEILEGGPATASSTTGDGPTREGAVRVATRVRGRGATDALTVGIDLGTSNTCVSIVRDGKPMVVPNRAGTTTIPSVLTLDDAGKPLVGHAAQKRMVLHPHRTVYGSKRLIGRAFQDEVADAYQSYFAWPIVETPDHRFGASLEGHVVSMEDVARHILAEVRQVAHAHLGRVVDRAVITVPAYFTEGQRDAVRAAARGAGLGVSRIVNEPTAAAVAYGFNRNEKARVAVFDLGGGTFDLSVLEVRGNRFQVLATGGDAFLGGIDVDDAIASHLLEVFLAETRAPLEPTPQQLARLRESAEEVKRGLSVQNRVAVFLPHFAEVKGTPRDLHAQLDREQLKELTRGFLDRLLLITTRVLEAGRIDPNSIDDVLLVGGSTRMPLVQEVVESLFGRRPSRRINPDEAVALGAALLAEESNDVDLVDVLPLSIGFGGSGRRFMRLVPRNTPVPAQRSFVVSTTVDGQTEYPVHLFQGERPDAARNEYLGSVVIAGIPPGPAGSRSYELTLALDDQCMLEVSANDPSTGAAADVRLSRVLSADAILAELGAYDGPPVEPDVPAPRGVIARLFARLRGLFGRA